jgi:hypothetical protein
MATPAARRDSRVGCCFLTPTPMGDMYCVVVQACRASDEENVPLFCAPDGMLRLIADLALASPAKSAAPGSIRKPLGWKYASHAAKGFTTVPNKRVGPPSPFHILPPSRVECAWEARKPGSPEARKPGSPEARSPGPPPQQMTLAAAMKCRRRPLLQICFGPGSGPVKIATRLARSRRPPIPHNRTIHWSKGLARATHLLYCMSCHGRIGHPHGHHPQSHPLHLERGLLIGCSAPKA